MTPEQCSVFNLYPSQAGHFLPPYTSTNNAPRGEKIAWKFYQDFLSLSSDPATNPVFMMSQNLNSNVHIF